jgi:hypothetical protein
VIFRELDGLGLRIQNHAAIISARDASRQLRFHRHGIGLLTFK